MQHILRKSLLALAVALAVGPAAATTLSFDDIGVDDLVPTNYGGLDWSTGGWTVFSLDQEPYTAHSGSARVVTGWGADDAASEIRFTSPVVFDGAWFAGYAEATVTFELYADGQLVATSSTLAPSDTPTWLASGYGGWIDAVRVSSTNHAYFAMDDLSFTAAVPEPQAAALMLMGLAGLSLVVVRRRSR